MLDSEAMIWLTPAMRVSCDAGASSGTDACMAGMWKAEPAERQAEQDVEMCHIRAAPSQKSAVSASVQRAMKLSARIIVRLRSQRST